MKRSISLLALLCILVNTFFYSIPIALAENLGNIKNAEISAILKETIIIHNYISDAFCYGEKLTCEECDINNMTYKNFGNVTVYAEDEETIKKAEKNVEKIELLFGIFDTYNYR